MNYGIIIEKVAKNKNKIAIVYDTQDGWIDHGVAIRNFVDYNFNPGLGTYNSYTWEISSNRRFADTNNFYLNQLFNEVGTTCYSTDQDSNCGYWCWKAPYGFRKSQGFNWCAATADAARRKAMKPLKAFIQKFESKKEKTFTDRELNKVLKDFNGLNVEVYIMNQAKTHLLIGSIKDNAIVLDADKYLAECCVIDSIDYDRGDMGRIRLGQKDS